MTTCLRRRVREFEVNGWNQAGRLGVSQQTPDRLPTTIAIVQREVVDVHPDEAVGAFAIEAAPKLHRVIDGFLAMVETKRDAVVQEARERRDVLFTEVATDDIATQR